MPRQEFAIITPSDRSRSWLEGEETPYSEFVLSPGHRARSRREVCLGVLPAPRKTAAVSEDVHDLGRVLETYGVELRGRVETDLRLGVLEKVVLELRHAILEIAKQRSTLVPITTFAPNDIKVVQPIFAVVQPDQDEFIATFFDANIHASGDTQVEAVENLKDIIADSFRRFLELGNEKLGPGPRQQMVVLKTFLSV